MRESRKKDRKEKIAWQAIQLFKAKGYEKVTVEEITQLCGIAKGTFFNYFSKKEDVLLYLVNSYAGLMDEIVGKYREEHVKKRLMNIFRELFHIYLQHADLLRVTLIETIKSAMASNGGSSANLSLFQDRIREMLEKAKHDGFLRSSLNPHAAASVLVAIFYHTLIICSGTADETKMTAVMQQQLDAVWEGIAGD